MKKVFILYLFFSVLLTAKAQKATMPIQAGVSALPVLDILKLYPGNDIKGLATTVNFGYFIDAYIALENYALLLTTFSNSFLYFKAIIFQSYFIAFFRAFFPSVSLNFSFSISLTIASLS